SDRAMPGSAVGWFVSDSGIVAILPTLAAGGSVTDYVASATDENGTPAHSQRGERRGDAPEVLILADTAARSTVIADSLGHIAGPSLATPLARFAHALSMQDFRVWIGALPAPAPKLLARRTVRERVSALAPFFVQGGTISPLWF